MSATELNAPSVPPILFVGAGSIGLPMLLRIAACGLQVRACDASEVTLAELERRGIQVYARDRLTPLRDSRVVLCLPDPDAASALITSWIEHGLPPDTVIADITTMSPSTARRHAELVAGAGGTYLDVPVSGGQRGAESGGLVVLAGGSAAGFHAILPVLRAIGRTVHHVGGAGSASLVKAVHQHVYLSYNLALAQGLRLGSELGLPEAAVRDVLTKGAAAHPLINDRLPTALASGFRDGFPLKRCLKDLECLELPDGYASPARDAAERLHAEIRAAVDAGMGDFDILALSRMPPTAS